MRLGSDSAPDLVIAPGFNVYQGAAFLEVPADIHVLELGAYLRSLAGMGSLDYRLCLWGYGGSVGAANKLLGKTALHTVSPAASAPENLLRVTWPLEEPVDLALGWQVLVGIAWETDPDKQALLGGYAGGGLRFRKDLADGSPWPVSMKDSVILGDHDMAAWIEAYSPQSGVFVYRGGEWLQVPDGDAVLVQRDGFFEPAAVRVRRAGAWVTARPPGGV